ncbi:DUF2213 domain-containing protein [Bradyrhizobium genosp. L]|uniref:DUF2213 domain-containing protein n=1 Tax=Bradyrhizobium genosp. L TaxID=83637 RepID=UPI001AED45F7|nr:DUF2213 domain-containing protein [Bradyrhizobium genosp. L]
MTRILVAARGIAADASGKLSEKEREEADRTHGSREDMPAGAFLEGEARKYPVKEKQDGEWVYSRNLLLAAAREARMHGHGDLAKRADTIRAREFGAAQDEALLSFDRASVRNYDANGWLHVKTTPISKANVCEYWGREIPGHEDLGLRPDQKYKLLRHPDELRKAASSFNNLPLLNKHVPISVLQYDPEDVIGSTGSDTEFDHPYLNNSLAVWRKDGIDDVESGAKKQLSSAYRYRADMTPGEFEGERYDGVMRDIVGNHVAIVPEGRAGPDVVVGDSMENLTMTLSRKALMVHGAVAAYLLPKLAQDAKIDVMSAFHGVTHKNFPKRRAQIVTDLTKLTAGKLAKDAKLSDLPTVLMAFDAMEPDEPKAKDEEDDKDKKAKDEGGIREFLKGKLSEDDYKAACDMMDDDDVDAMDEDDDKEKDKDKPKAEDEEDDKKDKVDRKAMDQAIADNTKAERDRARAVRDAERFVRPWVGDLAHAYDSAEEVYGAALEARGKSTKGLHPSAFKSVLEMLPKAGEANRPAPRLATDAKGSSSFNEMFPDAGKIKLTA